MPEERVVGVGPHELPWPDDERFDRQLLADGDARNVVDEYRYWSKEAIIADLDAKRHGFHVVIENWQHDFNIGTIVRNANAFLAHSVHIVGNRRWNRRGAMVTDRYQHIEHHETIDDFATFAKSGALPVVGIDIVEGSEPIESAVLPARCILAFGQEGPGLSDGMQDICDTILHVTQFGSTRSINVGVASGIAMYAWARLNA
jgi:tRNA G18 (ribose-2'-O)-methylase SpoU